MRFSQQKHRVQRSEAVLEGRILQARESHRRLQREWRQAWSPLRIVVAGLATGFIAGQAQPQRALRKLGRLSGPRTLQLVTSVAGLVGSIQAAIAAMTTRDAAGAAQSPEPEEPAAADASSPIGTAASAAGPGTAPHRRRPDPRWDSPPPPAEAATELSER